MLSQKDKDIVNKAKELWEKNVRTKFNEGHKATFNLLKPIWDDGSYIDVGNDVCPMCIEYLHKEHNCNNCPFLKILKKNCANSGGRTFCRNPTLENCNNFMYNFDIMLKEI